MPKQKKIFRIRNAFHEIEGEYSERQLLSRIKAGKYKGNEEVAGEPFTHWKKLSAEPAFYDAFVNKILGNAEDAGVPGTNSDGSVPESQPAEKLTRQEGAHEVGGKTEHVLARELSDSHDLKTHQNGEPVKDGTIHKSDIDKLFEKSASATLKKEALDPLADPGAGPSAVQPKISVSKEDLHLTRALPYFKKERRRTLLVATVVLGLLALLFNSGKEGGLTAPDGSSIVTAEGESTPPSEVTRKEILEALKEEARSFYLSDTPIFYRGTRDLMREALHYEEKSIASLGTLALSSAHLIESRKGSAEKIVAEIEQTIKKGREVEPHNSAFYRAEAILFLHQGEIEKAKEKLAAAKEADPTESENSLVQAEILFQSDAVEEARSFVQDAIRTSNQSVRAHHLYAKILFKLGQMEQAKNEAGEAARLNPLHSDSYTIVGDILSNNNQLKEAKIFYELATKLGQFATPPSLGHAHQRLGNLKEILGDTEGAKKNHFLADYYLSKEGDPGAYKQQIDDAIFETQYDRSYYQDRARELLRENRHVEALRFYQTVRLLYPTDSGAMVKVGEVMERLATSYEDFRRIMLLYQRAIERDPKSPKGYIRLALLETDQYNFEHALKLLTRALELNNEDAEVYIALGKHFYKRQDYIRARDYFSRAATINPTNSEVYYYYGLLTRLYKKDLVKEAMRLFSQSYTLDPQNYDGLAEWLKLKVQTYEKNFAIKFIRNLSEKEPTNPDLYWVFGEVYSENKEFRRSVTYYHKALDIDNRMSKVRMSLGRALLAIGEKESAVEEFRLASRLDRRNSEGFYEAASLLLEMKRIDLAEEVINQLIQTTPQYPGAHRLFSRIYAAFGKRDQAIAEMQKEVNNNPLNYKFTLEFAELYMAYERYDIAIQELQKVTSLPPETKAPEFKLERIRAYLLLSRCLRAQSKADNAEGAIKTAMGIDPNDPELHRELGYVYHSLQRDREATTAFKFYLSRNPAATDAGTIKALIQRMGTED